MNTTPRYEIGALNLAELWVDPAGGNDAADGRSRATALRTLHAAWKRADATRGWRIRLCSGQYQPDDDGQIHLRDRRGTRETPVLLEAADAGFKFSLPQLDVHRCDYLYLTGLEFRSPRLTQVAASNDNVLHFEHCHHILVREVKAIGEDSGPGLPRLALKANQCSHLYIEDSEFSGAYAYAFAYVAVQYGHIVRSRFSNSGASGICLKGGSAYHLVAANDVWDCRNIGILAGEGTGFPYLVSPWLQYEAYDIKAVNNCIWNCGGALGASGGYNILFAYNTAWRVGFSRDLVVLAMGGRGWVDGPSATGVCEQYRAAGGWCTRTGDMNNIPGRNIYVFNNLLVNPDGFESQFAHFGISGPVRTSPESNIPDPASLENLRIAGNLIWNGGPNKPVLDDVEHCYGLAARPTIDPAELIKCNCINREQPILRAPEEHDFYLQKLPEQARAVSIPDFDLHDAHRPPVPPGDADNAVTLDRAGNPRSRPAVGAYS